MARFIYPLKSFTLTQGFGADPAYYGQFGQKGHNGYDLGAPKGTPIYASGDGTIEFVGDGISLPWVGSIAGNYVLINHGDVRTGYAHLSKIAVGAGRKVKQGDVIGYVGATGAATGPHVHFEFIKTGEVDNSNGYFDRIDPGEYLGKETQPVMQLTSLKYLFRAVLNREMNANDAKKYLGKDPNIVIIDLWNWALRNKRDYGSTLERAKAEKKPADATVLKPGVYEVK